MIQPLISMIVPVYNIKEYLSRCVESVCSQTYSKLEIILVDDGSTDGSGELCDQFALKDERIIVVHKMNGGLVSAWKKGLFQSSGEYVCFVDGDDWIDQVMIEDMLSHITGQGKEIISCDYLIEKPGGAQAVYQTLPPGEYDRIRLEKQVFEVLLGNENRTVCFSRCMKLISRSLLEDNAHYSDERVKMGEDVTVMLPALLDCDRLVILDHKTYYHYWYNTVSMVHKYDQGLFSNIILLNEIIHTVIREKHMEQLQEAAEREYIFLLMLVLKNEARGNASGYRKNILNICRSEEVRKLCLDVHVDVEEKANKLLYLVMRYPNECTVRLLRLSMIIYYRKS